MPTDSSPSVSDHVPPVGARLSGPHWPTGVRVVRTEPQGQTRVLIEAVTLDERARLISRILTLDDLADVEVDADADRPTLEGDPLGFRLAAEATRIRLAHTYDPQFAASVARIDPLPHQLEAVYYYMLPQPRLRFLLADDPGAGKTIMAGLLLKELKLRGALTRTLVVAPANLVAQWQREMRDKFDERFDVVDRGALDAYGARAWEVSDQCVVSVDFAWQPDVMESLARASRWDLVIVDEAHKMAAYRRGKTIERTRRYRLGELLTEQTEHLLLMTATPHKGDPENFRLLLKLLDPDLFANTEILARAVRRQENPIFLRRLKEDMNDFDGKPLFPPRHVQTLGLELTPPEQALYEAVTRYVMETFNRALATKNRNVSFALIILQRRLASSVRAIRCSLENRRNRLTALRDEVLANPELLEAARRGESPLDTLPADAPEAERWEAEERALRYTVARNLDELEAEIRAVTALAQQALAVEESGPERKLDELRQVMEELDIFHSDEKLLIFTEAKDTLDYLLDYLNSWGLTVTHIDGSMPLPARYAAEEHFHDPEGAQVLVATEAAGEGINLQFCHLMINYDLPWNPTRLEQRMGRIHRYGQAYEVYIYNLVATSTREGYVFHALLEKLERMREGLGVASIVPAEAPLPVTPGGPDMRRDDEVEAIAMTHAAAYERHRGWRVEDVSEEDRGYDLLSHGSAEAVRYIEVKGRAAQGGVELSENEWLKAEQLGDDYWLYMVVACKTSPVLYVIRDPAHRLPREAVIPRVRYRVTREGWDQVAEAVGEYEA